MQAGRRGDKSLERIIPGGGGIIYEVIFALDTKDGATFTAPKGQAHHVPPPSASTQRGEQREFAAAQPAWDNEAGRNRINYVIPLAEKLGETLALRG